MPVVMKDQASRLRTLAKDLDISARSSLFYDERPRQVFDLMLVSGKHGVGKTVLSISIAVALAQWNKKVLIIDMDFTSNAFPLYFDSIVEGGIYDVIYNDIELKDLIVHHNTGVDFVANHVDLLTDFNFSKKYRTRFIKALDRIRQDYDYVIADCQGGISQNTKICSELAKKLLYITTTDPISVIDTYSLIKYLCNDAVNSQEFEIIINKVASEKIYKESTEKLNSALEQFLNFNENIFYKVEFSKLLQKRLQAQELIQDKDKYLLWPKQIRKLTKSIIN